MWRLRSAPASRPRDRSALRPPSDPLGGVESNRSEADAGSHQRGGARDQNASDKQVGSFHDLSDGIARREDRANLRTKLRRDPSQRLRRTIYHSDIRAHSKCNRRRVSARDAAAQNDDFRRGHPRHSAKQNPAPPLGALKVVGSALRSEPASNLGHRSQQRQRAGGRGHSFVGDTCRAATQEISSEVEIGCQMEIREQDLP